MLDHAQQPYAETVAPPRRTTNDVVLKLSRRGIERDWGEGYTSSSLALLMGIDDKTVLRWISKGWLKAYRRMTDNGDHGHLYAIHLPQVRRFVMDNPAAVDIRKVDKLWFIDMLAGRRP